MGNPNTGEIYELAEGQEPNAGDVALTKEVADRLRQLIPERRIEELQFLAREQAVTRELPRYKSHKEVWALKIKEVRPIPHTQRPTIAELEELMEKEGNHAADILPSGDVLALTGAMIIPAEDGYASFQVDAEYVRKHNPQAGGYYVVYKDGYKSFSPAEAFEEGYTRI